MRNILTDHYKAPSDWDPETGREHDQKYLNPAYRRRGLPLIKEYELTPEGYKVPLYTRAGKITILVGQSFLIKIFQEFLY